MNGQFLATMWQETIRYIRKKYVQKFQNKSDNRIKHMRWHFLFFKCFKLILIAKSHFLKHIFDQNKNMSKGK